MKYPISWLQAWTDLAPPERIADTLTRSGIEVDAIENDVVILELTANRGDCLSILGLARELSALFQTPLKTTKYSALPTAPLSLALQVDAKHACPHVAYLEATVPATAATPDWMAARLQAAGFACIHPVVDVLHYVMADVGQPLHAFDRDAIQGDLVIRLARAGEAFIDLQGKTHTLTQGTCVIADAAGILAIAGLIGGQRGAVSADTRRVLIESAYFTPETVQSIRHYAVHTEASYRFERGVDPALPMAALTACGHWLQEALGATLLGVTQQGAVPTPVTITLRADFLEAYLGVRIPEQDVSDILSRLGGHVKAGKQGWSVVAPSWRHDWQIEVDLVEEVARVYGYDRLPKATLQAGVHVSLSSEDTIPLARVKSVLTDAGFHEIMNYSFVDAALQSLIDPSPALALRNPIAEDKSVLRMQLWSSMLKTASYNQHRQHERIRLFEAGVCFEGGQCPPTENTYLAGLLAGPRWAEQWGMDKASVDFYDMKGIVEALLALGQQAYKIVSGTHTALHPGRSADVHMNGACIGHFGALHPRLMEAFEVTGPVFLFALHTGPLLNRERSVPYMPSKWPVVRRDLALLVPEAVTFSQLENEVRRQLLDWLGDFGLFDVYQGKGIPTGVRSMAVRLTLRHPERTLEDGEVEAAIARVLAALSEFGIQLRS
ncbi:MAG: phenylalanine--tRNA ligase subunit beta [Pseudomonadota bacterium]